MRHKHDNKTVDMEDVVLWPDGEWCYYYEFAEMTHKSDDVVVLCFGTEKYEEFLQGILQDAILSTQNNEGL